MAKRTAERRAAALKRIAPIDAAARQCVAELRAFAARVVPEIRRQIDAALADGLITPGIANAMGEMSPDEITWLLERLRRSAK